jgi:tRNA U55 pseudouridine synthase TruB
MKPLAAEQIPVGTSFQEGALLLVNKPKGWTSFDVVMR